MALQVQPVDCKTQNGARAWLDRETLTMVKEQEAYLRNIVCWRCRKTAFELGIDGFQMCRGCDADSDLTLRYFCSTHKKSSRVLHADMNHKFENRPIPSDIVPHVGNRQVEFLRWGALKLGISFKNSDSAKTDLKLSRVEKFVRGSNVAMYNGLDIVASNMVANTGMREFGKVVANSSAKEFVKTLGKSGTAKIVPLALFAVDFVMLSARLYNDKNFKWSDWAKGIGRSVASNGGMWVGGIAGAKVGVATGAWFGPLGAAIGFFVGSAVGGVTGEAATKGIYNAFFPPKDATPEEILAAEERKRRDFLMEAMRAFGFGVKDLENGSPLFNGVEIRRRYRLRAKECHPDRFQQNTQSWRAAHESFAILHSYLGVLLATVDEISGNNAAEKKRTEKLIKSITL